MSKKNSGITVAADGTNGHSAKETLTVKYKEAYEKAFNFTNNKKNAH